MNLKKPINENYAGSIVTLTTIIPLDNCDNVVHTKIFGNMVVVSKAARVGDKGIFFPAETALSAQYLRENNLYREVTFNKNPDEKGYFEENGRVKCVKFRGHRSEGVFMPLTSLLPFAEAVDLAALPENSTFDHINGVEICCKYEPKTYNTPGTPGSRKDRRALIKRISRIVTGQFRLHGDTPQLGKNLNVITPESILSITNKLHGTSFVVGKVLTNKKLGWFDRLLKWFGANLVSTEYGMVYSSRRVIKNEYETRDAQHYYGEDIWGLVAKQLEPLLLNGMTIYGEIVGFTPSGKAIQKGYDYGCTEWKTCTLGMPEGTKSEPSWEHKAYIYRITLTNTDGQVFELSARQVQDWCRANGLNPVPQYFYGNAWDVYKPSPDEKTIEEWQNGLLVHLQKSYNMEKDCELCKNSVPAEGLVVRIEGPDYQAFKLKSFRFREWETKQLDKGEVDIETEN